MICYGRGEALKSFWLRLLNCRFMPGICYSRLPVMLPSALADLGLGGEANLLLVFAI